MAVEGEVPHLQGGLGLGLHQDVRLGEIQQVNSSGWMSTICSPLRPMGWAHSAVTPCRVLRRAYWGRHRSLQSHNSEEELRMRVWSASCPSSAWLPTDLMELPARPRSSRCLRCLKGGGGVLHGVGQLFAVEQELGEQLHLGE